MCYTVEWIQDIEREQSTKVKQNHTAQFCHDLVEIAQNWTIIVEKEFSHRFAKYDS